MRALCHQEVVGVRFVIGLLVVTGAMATSGQAGVTCSDAEYKGAYAFSATGTLLQLPPEGKALLGAFSQSGRFLPDGHGKLFIETNASYNGIVINGDHPATYRVTPDCLIHFDLTLPFPLSVPSKFVGVLGENGKYMSLLLTEPTGTVIKGNHVRQDVTFCGPADFNGGYSIDLRGSTNVPAALAGRFQQIGRIFADGNGGFTGTSTANFNGRPVRDQISGTYQVSSKCYVTLRYKTATTGTESIVIQGAIGGHGEVVQVMILNDGWGVAGSLIRQQE